MLKRAKLVQIPVFSKGFLKDFLKDFWKGSEEMLGGYGEVSGIFGRVVREFWGC